MKFVDDTSWKIWQLETEDGTHYRTGSDGQYWERLYGESWEPVWGDEEEQCKQAWRNYFKVES